MYERIKKIMKTLTFKQKTINGEKIYIDASGIFIIKKRLPYLDGAPKWDLYVQNHALNYKYDRIYNYAFKTKKEIIEQITSLIDFMDVYIPYCYEFNDEQLALLRRTYKERYKVSD